MDSSDQPVKKRKITVQSAKAKGRNLQKHVVARILDLFPYLEPDDVRSTSMGASGEDVQLSPAARKALGVSIECKARERVAVYPWYFQCLDNTPAGSEPLLVVKQNNARPLAVVDLEFLLRLMRVGEGENAVS